MMRDNGFLGQLRQGHFDALGVERFLCLLQSINFGEAALVNRRVVALLWMIPTLMTWQIERVAEQGGNLETLRHTIEHVQELLQSPSVLGIP
jgi:hypothetical protein